MALTVVYEENLKRIYKASTWSAANLWRWLSETLIIAATLIVAFESQGFWRKTNTYLEQPKIRFDKRCMIVMSAGLADPFDYYFWSPYLDLNRAQADRLSMPIIEIDEHDVNNDQLIDEISISVALRVANESFAVRSVFWMLHYTASFKQHALVEMEGLLFGESEHLTPARGLSVAANLQFSQRKPLPSSGHYNFSQTLDQQLNETELTFDSALFVPYEIQRNALAHNYTFQLDRAVQRWETSNSPDNSAFTLNFRFLVPEQLLVYRTGALELLKWVWIQYFALSVLVRVIFDGFTSFMFQNQMIKSVVYDEGSKSKVY